MSRRVAVTGWGFLSSLGTDDDTVEEALRTARSGIVEMPEWSRYRLRSIVAGAVDDAAVREASSISKRRLETMGPVAAWSVLASERAIEHAGLERSDLAARDFACLVGSGVGCMPTIYEGGTQLYADRARRVRPHSVLQSMSSACSAHIVTSFGIGGRSYSLASACSTSTHAIGHAFELIRAGVIRGALAGGSEELSLILGGAFSALRTALSTRFNDQPERASRPFDRERDGFVLSAGAGVLALEELESARARGAPVLAEVVGFGANSDAFDLILPEPEGKSAAECMRAALEDAGLGADDVAYVNAHATGTPAGDLAEARALDAVFGSSSANRRPPPAVSSTKGATGHPLGAAGSLETIYCLLMLRGGFLAPCANLETVDPEIAELELDLVREERSWSPGIVVNNSFGFGGTNASLVLAPAS